MAGPAAPPVVPTGTEFKFTHSGSLDCSVAADVVSLGSDPKVHLEGQDHPLVKATSFAPWAESPAVPPATNSPGKYIPQSLLDSWCLMGGVMTAAFRNHPNVLLRSVRPQEAEKLFLAHVLVGNLDLSVQYTERTWENALASSANACRDDKRIRLEDSLFYDCQPRPASGAGSGASEHWQYDWQGDLLVESNMSTKAAAVLMRALAPRGISAERDASSKNFRRFLVAIRNVAKSRSDFFDSVLGDPATPVGEVREFVADTWLKLVSTGFTFKLGERMSQRTMELDSASQLCFGSSTQQALVCRAQLPEEIDGSELISDCIGQDSAGSRSLERMEAFEMLADIFFPGSKWATLSMVKALELELKELRHVIEAWAPSLSVTERLASLRSHMKSSKQLMRASKGGAGSQDGEESATGFIGASGIQAIRSASFIKTREAVKVMLESGGSVTFTDMLDLLSSSESKLWRAVAYGKLRKATGVEEVESCSKFVGFWAKYWTIGLATQPDGSVITEAQGESQSEANTEALLKGNWGTGINWIDVVQSIDNFCFAIESGEKTSYANFATLTSVKETVCKTMQLLKIASPNEQDGYTVTGFFDRLIRLERRSRALPKGSVARKDARSELVELMLAGLDEFGERWANQFKTPMNYMEPMITTFSDSNCFVYNKLDIAEDTAAKTYQFRKLLLKDPSRYVGADNGSRSEDEDEASPGASLLHPCSYN